jgi:hypothetical protein
MYMREPSPGAAQAAPNKSFYIVFTILVSAALVLHMGMSPGRWLGLATEAVTPAAAPAAPTAAP